MCRGRYEAGAEGGCLLFFRFLAILATIGGVTLIAIGASSWGQRELTRTQELEAYRTALATSTNPWTDTAQLPTATAQQGTGPVQGLTPQTSIVYPVNGEQDGFDPVTTRLLGTTVFPWYPAGPLSLSLTPRGPSPTTDNLTVVIPFSKLLTATIECDLASCASDCSRPGGMTCNNASLTRACKAAYNALAYYVGDNECSSNDGECGTCYYPAFLTAACLVVAPTDSANGYVFDRTMDSCYYPFSADSQQYDAALDVTLGTAVQRHVTVELRVNTDPYIFMQRATSGKMYFPTRRVSGPAVLIGIGIALVVSFWIGLGCCRAWQRRRERDAEDCQTTQAIPMAPYPTQQTAISIPGSGPSMPPPQPVEGVLYGQGPVIVSSNEPRNPVAQVPADAETYPGVPLKPLRR